MSNYPDFGDNISTFIPLERSLKSDKLLTQKQELFLLGDYFPIPFSDESRVRITRYLELERTEPYLPYETKDLSPEELNQLNYLILSLDSYFSQKNKYHTKRHELIPLIMSNEGLKTLKRMRVKSFLESNRSKLIDKPDWWDETKSVHIEDIGEIYNYTYGMFWETPDDKDYLNSQLPLDLDPEMVEKFKDIADRIISACDDFNPVTPLEILLRVSSSMTLNGEQTVPHFSAKNSNLNFSDIRSPGKRVLITTSPGQGRDAIINNINDLNQIQLINENVRSFLNKNFREFLLLDTFEQNKRRYFAQCKKSTFFYCRDIFKEGITKPKYLLEIMLKALQKRYPENSAFHSPYFYSGPWYENDTYGRGHGLGMANELTTLMQILIFKLTNEVLGEEGNYIVAKDAFFLNDDAAIFFDETATEDLVEDFIDCDFSVCLGLGVLAKRDKSFYSSNCCVFCEMYYSKLFFTMNDKESYLLRETRIIERVGSVLEAKFLLGNLKGDLHLIENLLAKTYSKFGYEFHKNEIDWPISIGGMRPFKLRGTDLSLMFLESEPDIKNAFKAYRANKSKKLWSHNKFLKNYRSPLETIFPSVLAEQDERILNKIGIMDNYNLASTFFRPSKEHKFHKSIDKLAKKRQKIFNEPGSITFEDFCKIYASESMNNVKLPEMFCEKHIEVNIFTMKDFKNPYFVKNPISSYLNYKGIASDSTIPSTVFGLFQSDIAWTNEKSVAARARTFNTLSLIDRFEENFEIDLLVFPKRAEDVELFMESYPQPFFTSELIVEGNKLPIPKKEFRNPDLMYRKEIFGSYLSFYHIKLAQSHDWRELLNVVLFERMFPSTDYDFEFWEGVFKKLKFRKFVAPPKSPKDSTGSSSDSEDDPFSGGLNLPNIEGMMDDLIILDQPVYTEEEVIEKSSSSSEELVFNDDTERIIFEVEKEQEERDRGNPFLIANGELPDGDETVYGSKGWVEWFVQQNILIMEEYAQADEELERASDEVMRHVNQISTSHLMEEHNERVKLILEFGVKRSWIAFYYKKYIETEVVEDEEMDTSSLFE